MVLDLRQLFALIGETVPIDYALDLSAYRLYDSTPFVTPVRVCGEACNRAGIVTVRYTCAFTMRHVCDRCLEPFDRAYHYAFSHTLVPRLNPDSDDDYIEVGQEPELLLDELVLADILLELPTKILCRADCRGLCSVCGANLNRKDCACNKTAADPRLAVLGTLLEE